MSLSSEVFNADEVVERLKAEPVVFEFCHKYGAYDDYYSISFDSEREWYDVAVRTSVWDGRGHEESQERLTEEALLALFGRVHADGLILFVTYRSGSS